MSNIKHSSSMVHLYQNRITLEKIKNTLCPEKTNKDFVNLVFGCLKDPGQLTFTDSFGEKHLPSFMKGNHDGQKRLNTRKLKLWSESICQDTVFLEMAYSLTIIADAQKITKQHVVYQLFLLDKNEMPDALTELIECRIAEQDHGKALLLMILWSIYGKEYIDILHPLYQNTQRLCKARSAELLACTKPCRPIFKGRDMLIAEINQFFLSGEKFLFLQGMGGIGKSECAKQYAKRYKSQYDTVIFAEYSDFIVNLINDNSVFTLTAPFMSERMISADGEIESDYHYYKRKLAQIRLSSNDRTLIILDNLDQFDPELEMILTGPFRVLITTRWRCQNVYPHNTIEITEIQSKDTLKEIFSAHYGRNVSDDIYVDQMIYFFQGHTMALELIARQMRASCLSSKEMLKNIKSVCFNHLAKKEGMNEKFLMPNLGGTSMDFSHFIQKLFDVSKLTENEKYIMLCLSLMPISGVDKKSFKEWCDLEDYNDMNVLIDRSWIRELDGILSMHTLVKEAVHCNCKPDLRKYRRLLEGLMRAVPTIKFYFMSRSEKVVVEKIALHLYSMFPQPTVELLDFYEWLELIFSHCCQYTTAVDLETKLLTIYRGKFGEKHFRTARMLWRNACQLIHHFDLETAVVLMEQSRRLIKSLGNLCCREEMYLSDIDIDLVTEYLEMYDESNLENNSDKVRELCHEIILIRKKYKDIIQDPFHTCAFAYQALAWLEIIDKNYDRAAEYLLLAFEECKSKNCDFMQSFGYYVYSKLELAKSNNEDAIKYMKLSIQLNQQYFGTHDASFIKKNVELGKLYENCKMLDDAYEQYRKTYDFIENLPRKEQKLTAYIENRLKYLKNSK